MASKNIVKNTVEEHVSPRANSMQMGETGEESGCEKRFPNCNPDISHSGS